MGRIPQGLDDHYSDEEAQQRFMIALKAAVNTKPRPLKSMPRKGLKRQQGRRKKAKSGA
jgi:hypothetical protein